MKVTDDDIRRASIMVVDDSMVSLRKMEEILENDGYYQVHTVSDPTKVVDLYEEIDPSLIILDYHMPKMSGMEVLQKLNDVFPDRPRNVLFWTSESEEFLLDKALKRGAQDVLRKDEVEPAEIHCRVRNLVRIRLSALKIERQNERLRERVREQTQRIREVSLESISRLSQAAEFRDNETGAHIQRIGRLTSELARLLGMDDSTCEAIQYASTMHDIGKVMVPDDILFKPDSLNDNEWTVMKQHTTYGSKILSDSDQHYLQMAERIARYHHEHWNGDGYPEGLKGARIPIEARITAVCDVFDAVLSDRPYKDPWPMDRALNLIEDESGEQFDPDVAETFLAHSDELIRIRSSIEEEDPVFAA